MQEDKISGKRTTKGFKKKEARGGLFLKNCTNPKGFNLYYRRDEGARLCLGCRGPTVWSEYFRKREGNPERGRSNEMNRQKSLDKKKRKHEETEKGSGAADPRNGHSWAVVLLEKKGGTGGRKKKKISGGKKRRPIKAGNWEDFPPPKRKGNGGKGGGVNAGKKGWRMEKTRVPSPGPTAAKKREDPKKKKCHGNWAYGCRGRKGGERGGEMESQVRSYDRPAGRTGGVTMEPGIGLEKKGLIGGIEGEKSRGLQIGGKRSKRNPKCRGGCAKGKKDNGGDQQKKTSCLPGSFMLSRKHNGKMCLGSHESKREAGGEKKKIPDRQEHNRT